MSGGFLLQKTNVNGDEEERKSPRLFVELISKRKVYNSTRLILPDGRRDASNSCVRLSTFH